MDMHIHVRSCIFAALLSCTFATTAYLAWLSDIANGSSLPGLWLTASGYAAFGIQLGFPNMGFLQISCLLVYAAQDMSMRDRSMLRSYKRPCMLRMLMSWLGWNPFCDCWA